MIKWFLKHLKEQIQQLDNDKAQSQTKVKDLSQALGVDEADEDVAISKLKEQQGKLREQLQEEPEEITQARNDISQLEAELATLRKQLEAARTRPSVGVAEKPSEVDEEIHSAFIVDHDGKTIGVDGYIGKDIEGNTLHRVWSLWPGTTYIEARRPNGQLYYRIYLEGKIEDISLDNFFL